MDKAKKRKTSIANAEGANETENPDISTLDVDKVDKVKDQNTRIANVDAAKDADIHIIDI